MRRIAPIFFVLLALLSGQRAHAEDPATFDRLDAAFGEWVVGPLASVMFFDTVFWDNTLPLGQGVGTVVDGEEVTGWNAAEGYALQPRFEAPAAAVVPLLEAPLRRSYGQVEIELRTARNEGGRQLVAKVVPKRVDLAALGLEGATEGPHTLTDIAPFPVIVDTSNGRLQATEVPVPSDAVPLERGMAVWTLAQGRATVLSVDVDLVQLRADTLHTTQAALANPENAKFPAVVLWLVLGAIFFTLRMQFVNVRAFGHALYVTAGVYDNPDDPGEISHFQALSSALSATVGLGNIAGVAVAITVGGPGAIFWMVMAALLGMSSKFTECSLGQMYRITRSDGTVSGGPMHYLHAGLSELGLGPLGRVLSAMFALMCIGGSFGGGNMFQANQSYAQIASVVPLFEGRAWLYGIILAFCVGLVIIGGIKRIGMAASVIVPVMCGIYVLAAIAILVANASAVPGALVHIVSEAFSPTAGMGGLIGVLATGFQRASFSNEAGIGSASIAHSAASTDEPIREGIVALLEPFIDTVIVCTMTGLVVVVTGAYKLEGVGDGVQLTSKAFETVLPWFPLVLSFAVVMFAFSTMISWSYYGERCAVYLFGERAVIPYKVMFLFFVFFGSVIKLGSVLDFSDLMVLSMAAPNILGAVLLSGKVKRELDAYLGKLRRGEFRVHGST